MADQTHKRTETTTAELAERLQAAFRRATADAIHQAHQAHLPVPVLGQDGQIAWLHPDGVSRPTRDVVLAEVETAKA